MKIIITPKGAFIRNLATALVNGALTLALLLIAPLGLAAVIINTILVMISTFVVNSGGDWVVQWLLVAGGDRQKITETSRSFLNDWPVIAPDSSPQLGDRQDGDQ